MQTYLTPGVYVEEVASGSAPIAGAGTSVAAFIGMIPLPQNESNSPDEQDSAESKRNSTKTLTALTGVVNDEALVFSNATQQMIKFKIPDGYEFDSDADYKFFAGASNDYDNLVDLVADPAPELTEGGKAVAVTLKKSGNNKLPTDSNSIFGSGLFKASQQNDSTKNASAAGGVNQKTEPETSVQVPDVKLCTNFGEFKVDFGDFGDFAKDDEAKKILAHAVYGFFRNGGTRCYVSKVSNTAELREVLTETLEAIDEISIVAAPGCTDNVNLSEIKDHCKKMGDRVAVLDGENVSSKAIADKVNTLGNSEYAALYYPWIKVYDPASKGQILVPPSGHIAGVYARVDAQRGVHKAPANEAILGAMDVSTNLSKAKQGDLNPVGINCLRKMNGNIMVWGGRTLGEENGEFKYVNVRRYFCYLKDSIDKGTQWTTFEPNTPELWAKIRRNVSAFLTAEWRKGALFGTTPQEAFFVKCDAENNPQSIRDQGQVVTEIGVSVVKPAEFVIFYVSQWAGDQ